MGQNARKHGGLIIHILVAAFTFIGLAIVCDEYFVSSLDRICEGRYTKLCSGSTVVRAKWF
jgi:solute carrier family 24 (sodium/potassium/calcium exchanger), member 4